MENTIDLKNLFKNSFKRLTTSLKFEYKKPIIEKNNQRDTFIVWEPCSISHSEVVPGFAKYLSDLGFNVSIIVHKDRYKEGLFSRISNPKEENFFYNKMSKREINNFFRKNDLKDYKGVLVTTAGKICDCIHYNEALKHFHKNTDKNKVFLVEHDIKHCVNEFGKIPPDIITLRKMDYKNAKTTAINPHYFGDFKRNKKNEIVNFITIGHIAPHKKNTNEIIEAFEKLVDEGVKNFKLTVIGRGKIKHFPKILQPYIAIKGRLSYEKMYNELDNADFLLTAYNKERHKRYITSGTSGNFQLVYGFLKPCIIEKAFAPINGFNEQNSIIYEDSSLKDAIKTACTMTSQDYENMRNNLEILKNEIYNKSLENFKDLLKQRGIL